MNWNTGTVPSANDDVGIRSAPMVNIDSAAAAHSLNSASSLDVIGSLALYAPSAVTEGVLLIAGTLDLEGGANLDLYSYAQVDGTVWIASGTQLTLHTGTFGFGAATVVGDGLLRVTDNATASIDSTPTVENFSLEPTGSVTGMGTLTITGALDWTGGAMRSGGVTQIAAGATAALHGDAKVNGWVGRHPGGGWLRQWRLGGGQYRRTTPPAGGRDKHRHISNRSRRLGFLGAVAGPRGCDVHDA